MLKAREHPTNSKKRVLRFFTHITLVYKARYKNNF